MVSEIEARYAEEISDDISIASTASSDQQSDYELETILADRTNNGIKEYLVKWANYHTLKSSWEPAGNLNQEETLLEWEEKKAKIRRGELPAFDIEKFERAQFRAKARGRARKKRNRVLKAHTKQDEIRSLATHQELTKLLFSDNSDCEPESATTRAPGARSEGDQPDHPDSPSALFVPREILLEQPPQQRVSHRPTTLGHLLPAHLLPVRLRLLVAFLSPSHTRPKVRKAHWGAIPLAKRLCHLSRLHQSLT